MNLQLSIVIPFYGNADKRLLDHCLQTIREQNGLVPEAYEIIVTDDRGRGPGAGAARNEGIRRAKGEYIFFIDADDYLFPDALTPCFTQAMADKPDIVSFGFSKVTAMNQEPPTKNRKQAIFHAFDSGADYMLEHNFTGTIWRHLFRREFLLHHQLFFTEGIYIEDEEFLAKAYFFAAKTWITDAPVYAYYQHPHSIMHKDAGLQHAKRIESFRQIVCQLQEFRQAQTQATSLQLNALDRRIHFLTIDYLIQLKRNRCSFRTIRREIKRLVDDGFLPLPARKYSWKYSAARIFIHLLARL